MLKTLYRFTSMQTLAHQGLQRGLTLPRNGCSRPNRLLIQAFRQLEAKQQKSSNTVKAAPRRDFLEARQLSLYELFDGNAYQFDIPEYQRPYAWKAKQVHELLEDLQAAYHSGQEHFLGAIVATRQGDSPGEPYWVIDGQQRLTTLVMLLGYLRAWASSQPNQNSLAARVEHMLHIPADPLNPQAKARYRLRLRGSDQQWFTENFIMDYLPVRYHLDTRLDGPTNAPGDYHEATARMKLQQQWQSSSLDATPSFNNANSSSSSSSSADQRVQDAAGQSSGPKSAPLTNETWWRMYCAGDVLACYLVAAISSGLNLQEFMHHVLKNCMVVLMIARDESTSFKIFSTLNGRGVDLAVVDKLKPELLQALPVQLRESYADRWTALESALGRPSFHALFDHFITIEQTAAAVQCSQTSWAHTSNEAAPCTTGNSNNSSDPSSISRPPGFIPAGSSLVTHLGPLTTTGNGRHPPASAMPSTSNRLHNGPHQLKFRWNVLEHLSNHSNVEGVLNMVLEYGHKLLQIRANDWSNLAAEGDAAPAIAAELEECCFFINLLSDDCWQPWTLEFFYQSADDAKRAQFLKRAELLQVYCELKQDEAFKQERWTAVGAKLLQRPFFSDQVLDALALTPDEEDEFVLLLDSRELAASADERLLVHLLLRADSINRKSINWRRLKVEKIVPAQPPEGSLWRKQKLLLPELSEEQLATSMHTSPSFFSPTTRRSSGSGSSKTASAGSSSSSRSSNSRSSRGKTSSTSSLSSSDVLSSTTSLLADDTVSNSRSSVDGGLVSGTITSNSSRGSSSSSVPEGKREVRYWHEITRSHWHNRLGNLVLLQPSGSESAATSHLSANLPRKLEHYRECAADEHFPDFSGGLVNGRYTRDLFSPDECRQRHGDIISRIMQVFGLVTEEL